MPPATPCSTEGSSSSQPVLRATFVHQATGCIAELPIGSGGNLLEPGHQFEWLFLVEGSGHGAFEASAPDARHVQRVQLCAAIRRRSVDRWGCRGAGRERAHCRFRSAYLGSDRVPAGACPRTAAMLPASACRGKSNCLPPASSRRKGGSRAVRPRARSRAPRCRPPRPITWRPLTPRCLRVDRPAVALASLTEKQIFGRSFEIVLAVWGCATYSLVQDRVDGRWKWIRGVQPS